jgi:hypothetical protein
LRHLHTKHRGFTKTGSGRTEEKLEEKRGVSAGVSLAAVALAFAALPSVVDKLVVGMRHEDEVAMVTTKHRGFFETKTIVSFLKSS